MAKFASKDQAAEAKSTLENLIGKKTWFKKIELDTDDHGYYLKLKITSMNDVRSSNDNIPGSIPVAGFNMKVCIFSVG